MYHIWMIEKDERCRRTKGCNYLHGDVCCNLVTVIVDTDVAGECFSQVNDSAIKISFTQLVERERSQDLRAVSPKLTRNSEVTAGTAQPQASPRQTQT